MLEPIRLWTILHGTHCIRATSIIISKRTVNANNIWNYPYVGCLKCFKWLWMHFGEMQKHMQNDPARPQICNKYGKFHMIFAFTFWRLPLNLKISLVEHVCCFEFSIVQIFEEYWGSKKLQLLFMCLEYKQYGAFLESSSYSNMTFRWPNPTCGPWDPWTWIIVGL